MVINRIYDTEEKYIKCFCVFEQKEGYTRYKDDHIKDMYSHNFVSINHQVTKESCLSIIENELDYRKKHGFGYLRIKTSAPIIHDVLKSVSIKPELETYDYWGIETSNHQNMFENKAVMVKKADQKQVNEDGRLIDIVANYRHMTLEFAIRRIDRKFDVYSDQSKPLNLYVCYDGIEPVGNCELMINGDTAKIEDFDILDIYQKKGFGTQVIRNLLKLSLEKGVTDAYLVTDHDDTAKDMYQKSGFKLIGQMTELMFILK